MNEAETGVRHIVSWQGAAGSFGVERRRESADCLSRQRACRNVMTHREYDDWCKLYRKGRA